MNVFCARKKSDHGLLADGVATLDSIEIHGPSDQLEIVKPGTEALGTKYFAIDSGFSKFV